MCGSRNGTFVHIFLTPTIVIRIVPASEVGNPF